MPGRRWISIVRQSAIAAAFASSYPSVAAVIDLSQLPIHGKVQPSDTFPIQTKGVPGLSSVSPSNVANFVLNSIKANGAVGDGVNDDTTAIQIALTAAASGGNISIPCGVYLITSAINVSLAPGASLFLNGGGLDCAVMKFSANSGITINYGSRLSSVHVHDLTLAAGAIGGGAAITLAQATANPSPAYAAANEIQNVMIRGADGLGAADYWATGVAVRNVSVINFINLNVIGPATTAGVGVSFIGLPASNIYSAVYNFTKNVLNLLSVGLVYNSFVQGVTVTASNFTGDTIGIQTPPGATGVLQLLAVSDCQFNTFGNAIQLDTKLGGLSVVNSEFIMVNPNTVGIKLTGTEFNITGNGFFGGSTKTGTVGVEFASGGAFGSMVGNSIIGLGTGVLLDAGSSGVMVGPNQYASNTVNVTNNGTNTLLENGPWLPHGVGASFGYGTGDGGAVTQTTLNGTVTINKPVGQITMFAAAGTTGLGSFTVNDSAVTATDTLSINMSSVNNIYSASVYNIKAGSFQIAYYALVGNSVTTPVINFAVIKGSAN